MAEQAQPKMITINLYGKRYRVPDNMTMLKALEYCGYAPTRGIGCRHGFCGACAMVYRIKGEPKAVHPFLGCSGMDGVHAPDNTVCVLEYESGPSFVKTADVERGGFLRRQLVVTGTKETVVVEPLEKSLGGEMLTTGYRNITGEEWGADGERMACEPYHRYKNMMLGFASFVRGEAKNPYDYTYEKNVRRLVQKCCGLGE